MRRWYRYLYWKRLIHSVSHTSKFLPAFVHNPTNETITINGITNERTNKPTSGTISGTTNQRTITNQRTKQPTNERNKITTTSGTISGTTNQRTITNHNNQRNKQLTSRTSNHQADQPRTETK